MAESYRGMVGVAFAVEGGWGGLQQPNPTPYQRFTPRSPVSQAPSGEYDRLVTVIYSGSLAGHDNSIRASASLVAFR
jgi:hypothetical protein